MDRSTRAFVIVALSVAAVALPSLVNADSSHTGVHIIDPDGTGADLQAQVNAGRLQVQSAPDTRSGVPYRTTIFDQSSTSGPTVTALFPATQQLAISSLTYSNFTTNDATAALSAFQPTSGQPCTGSSGTGRGSIISLKVKAGQVVSIPFPYPYVAPPIVPNGSWCLRHSVTGTSASALLVIVGYKI